MHKAQDWIRVRGARTHNLHNLSLDLPRGQLVVLTGPSGSGKSSLAFDTIFAEGQRRYLETLGTNTRALFQQLRRPEVDVIDGLPPVLCVAQHTGSPRPRSTLATLTEIHDHLRLLWARLGLPHCYQCGLPIRKHAQVEIARTVRELPEGRKIFILAPLVRDQPGAHADVFQDIRQGGYLRARVDGVLQEIRDTPKLNAKQPHTIELVVDRLVVRAGMEDRLNEAILSAVKLGNGQVTITDADEGDWRDLPFSTRFACPRCQIAYEELEPRRFHFNNPYGACPRCTGLGKVRAFDAGRILGDLSLPLAKVVTRLSEQLGQVVVLKPPEGSAWDPKIPLRDWPTDQRAVLGEELVRVLQELAAQAEREEDQDLEEGLEALAIFVTCPECNGGRLNREARSVLFAGQSLPALTALTVDAAHAFFEPLLRGTESEFGSPVTRAKLVLLGEITSRLFFLREVGLGYLTLDRPATSLSGGEFQRARLATQLGGGLFGVCYILDEPTVGLHPRDTDRLILALRHLQKRGNSVLVVEHDEAVMRQADFLVDLGPGAGPHGGHILAQGTLADVLKSEASVTAPFLRDEPSSSPFPKEARGERRPSPPSPLPPAGEGGDRNGEVLVIRGARHHNLKNIDVAIPLGKLVCVTGVSGSGKSSLVRDVLAPAVRRHLRLFAPDPGEHSAIEGLEKIDKIIEVNQKPIGRSARSNPASYTGLLDEIRKVFAGTRTAKIRGYKANRFSFNVKGGRCEKCQGQGELRMALAFLPELTVPCPECHGKRFNAATLEVLYRGKSIADVLAMPVEEALTFFENIPALARILRALADVGLGYVTLGQPAPQLSGGEAQRIKLATELARTATGRTLFLLDEPTTGLHRIDIAPLVRVFRQLAAAGNTIVVIEHHPAVIAAADWVIDLGPEAGAAGGHLVVAGTPETIANEPSSITGRFLKAFVDGKW